jgi:LAO/AO transport system kinase
VWEQVCAHRSALEESGELATKRADQEVSWMWSTVQDRVLHRLRHDPGTRETVAELEAALHDGSTTAARAAQRLLDELGWTG